MAVVLFSDDNPSSKLSVTYERFPQGVGVKLGLEQHFGFDERGVNPLYKNLKKAKALAIPVVADPKLFGTPKTLYPTSQQLTGLGVTGFTVAAKSGMDALKATVLGRDDAYLTEDVAQLPAEKPIIFAVAEVSSKSNKNCADESGNAGDTWEKSTARLICEAQKSGVDGVVCTSFSSIVLVRKIWPKAVILATSVRTEWATWVKGEDQRHWITPEDIIRYNVEYAAVGRIVSDAPDPFAALERACREINPSS